MELVGIALARVVAFIEMQGLDPVGKISAPEGLQLLGDRYSFAKTPQTLADIDFQKGVEFGVGKLGQINIDKMTFYLNGLVIDTRSSTDDCEKVLQDFIDVFARRLGSNLNVNRRNLVSHVIFRSSLRLSLLNPLLDPIAARLTSTVSREVGQSVPYEPTLFALSPDLSQIKLDPIAFTIERRAQVPFSENMYFSSAPLQTNDHLDVLREVEASLTPR